MLLMLVHQLYIYIYINGVSLETFSTREVISAFIYTAANIQLSSISNHVENEKLMKYNMLANTTKFTPIYTHDELQ